MRHTLALLLALVAVPVRAQIATDRPGFALSPTVVPDGAVQVELGTPQLTRAGGSSLVTTPAGLRVGLTPRVEARLSSPLLSVRGGEAGLGDVEVGAKVQVLAGATSLAVVPSVVLPVGSDVATGGTVALTTTAVLGTPLPGAFGLTLVAGAAVPTEAGTDPSGTLVALVGRSLSPAVSAYAEASAFPGAGPLPATVGAGVTVLAAPRLQLDAFADVGVTAAAADVVAGVGVSFRLR